MAVPDLSKELIFTTSRSRGKGGQHINKTETRVELWFHIASSSLLSMQQKEILVKKLQTKINKSGYLHISSELSRSMQKNKEDVTNKLYRLLNKALKPVKKRKPSRPGKQAKEKRLMSKKIKSEVKQLRKKIKI